MGDPDCLMRHHNSRFLVDNVLSTVFAEKLIGARHDARHVRDLGTGVGVSNTKKIVRIIAEALGEHGEPRVASVNSVVVLSAEEGWSSLPANVNGIVTPAVSKNSEIAPCKALCIGEGR